MATHDNRRRSSYEEYSIQIDLGVETILSLAISTYPDRNAVAGMLEFGGK